MKNSIKTVVITIGTAIVALAGSMTADRMSDHATRIIRMEDKINMLHQIDGKLEVLLNHFNLMKKHRRSPSYHRRLQQ